jgi:hypothetical protein
LKEFEDARMMSIRMAVVASALHAIAAEAPSGITFGPARFSVISDSLIRLELGSPRGAAAAAAVFDERPTLSYPGGRQAAQAKHTVAHPSADVIAITTDELVLRYDRSASKGAFTNVSLSVTLSASGAVWHPGDVDPNNLRGTRLDIGCYATFESCYCLGPPGRLSALSVFLCKSVFYGAFVWALSGSGRLTVQNGDFRPGQRMGSRRAR